MGMNDTLRSACLRPHSVMRTDNDMRVEGMCFVTYLLIVLWTLLDVLGLCALLWGVSACTDWPDLIAIAIMGAAAASSLLALRVVLQLCSMIFCLCIPLGPLVTMLLVAGWYPGIVAIPWPGASVYCPQSEPMHP